MPSWRVSSPRSLPPRRSVCDELDGTEALRDVEVGGVFEGWGPAGVFHDFAALDAVEVGAPAGAGGGRAGQSQVGEGEGDFGDPADIDVRRVLDGAGDADRSLD